MRIQAGTLLLAASSLQSSCHAALPSLSSSSPRAAVVSPSHQQQQQRRRHQRRQGKDILASSLITTLHNSRGGSSVINSNNKNNKKLFFTTLPSTIVTIVGQTLNIGIATIVSSGYLGCYIASRVVVTLHQHYQLQQQQQQQQQVLQSSSSSSSLFSSSIAKKFQWTIIASIGHIILNHNTLFFSSSSSSLFLPTLWIYSSTINNTLGGYIGCTHLILDLLSYTLGSNIVINYISSLMDIRLPVLDEEGNCSYDVNTFDTGYKSSLPQHEEGGTSSSSSSSLSSWKTRGMIRTLKEDVLVRTLSSLDIFTSFPKDSLMNYMMLSWISSLLPGVDSVDGNGDGMLLKVVKGQWLPWWKIGLLFDINNGDGDSRSSIGVDAKMISLRLFALHWIIMFIKGMTAFLLSW